MKARQLKSLSHAARSSSLLGLCTISFCVFSAGHDFANVTGALTYGGTMTIDIGSIFGAGTYSWNLFDLAGADLGTFATVTLADQYTGSLLDGDFDGVWDLTSGNDSWQFTESTGVLGFNVIPEPATALLGGLGLLTLFRRRRALRRIPLADSVPIRESSCCG